MDVGTRMFFSKAVVFGIIVSVLVTMICFGMYHYLQVRQITFEYSEKNQILQTIIFNYENTTKKLADQISTLDDTVLSLQGFLEEVNASLLQNVSELEKLRMGSWYVQHDPTYREVASFIRKDTTDHLPYNETSFHCMHFAERVNINAEQQGLRCALVVLYFEETEVGHAIVGFNTSDNGMVFVEPQSDEWAENLVVGNDFWTDCIVPNADYYYEDVLNDTIREIIIFW